MSSITGAARVQVLSALAERYQSRLEELMFFNPGQGRASASIRESIARHGIPEIVVEDQLLYVSVGSLGRVQALYALAEADGGDELVGVLVYFRPSVESLVILHVAVSETFGGTGEHAETLLVVRLVQTVRQAARCLKGVRSLTLYSNGAVLNLPVKRPPPIALDTRAWSAP